MEAEISHAKKGTIAESIQMQAKKLSSPVTNDFLIAARRGFADQVIQALNEGGSAKAATTDKYGRNCLQLAVIHGHYETASKILEMKLVDIDAVNKRGLTALHDACSEGHARLALLLLSAGASITAQTKDGWTCLMSACSNGHLKLVKIMLAAGCDLDASTKLGLTSLHIAAWKGHSEVVELLLHEGCNPQTVAQSGKTALQLALEENQHQAATLLTAATSKQSEDPVCRISSLEGQLRLCQNKLSESLRNYELELVRQQLSSKVAMETMQNNHQIELNKALGKINDLEKKIEEIEKQTKPKSPTTVNPPPLVPKSPSTKRRRSKKLEPQSTNTSKSELPDTVVSPPKNTTNTTSSDTDLLKLKDRPKSASYGDLSEIINETKAKDLKLPHTPQVSPAASKKEIKRKNSRRESTDRNTITALVAESLANPSSMLAIRKELKSDSFTPKIQRKFNKSSPRTASALPSMSPKSIGAGVGEEKSPKTSKKGL